MNEITHDEISIEALQAQDRREFARLVEYHSPKIYRLALKMLGNQQDAEDILQNTFVKVLQNIQSFEGRSSLTTWIYRIAANEALMHLRKRKPEIQVVEGEPDEGDESLTSTQFVDWCCLPEHELVSAESKRQLDRAIQKLPESLRVVFILRDIEGLSIRETSEALDLTETAVKTRLLRARLRLRELLSVYFGERIGEEKLQ